MFMRHSLADGASCSHVTRHIAAQVDARCLVRSVQVLLLHKTGARPEARFDVDERTLARTSASELDSNTGEVGTGEEVLEARIAERVRHVVFDAQLRAVGLAEVGAVALEQRPRFLFDGAARQDEPLNRTIVWPSRSVVTGSRASRVVARRTPRLALARMSAHYTTVNETEKSQAVAAVIDLAGYREAMER
jgi:hypothetical protein